MTVATPSDRSSASSAGESSRGGSPNAISPSMVSLPAGPDATARVPVSGRGKHRQIGAGLRGHGRQCGDRRRRTLDDADLVAIGIDRDGFGHLHGRIERDKTQDPSIMRCAAAASDRADRRIDRVLPVRRTGLRRSRKHIVFVASLGQSLHCAHRELIGGQGPGLVRA
jgi:hypothetical protein